MDQELIDWIESMAADFRRAYRLDSDAPIVVELPPAYADQVCREHGSLEAATRDVFAGRVALGRRES